MDAGLEMLFRPLMKFIDRNLMASNSYWRTERLTETWGKTLVSKDGYSIMAFKNGFSRLLLGKLKSSNELNELTGCASKITAPNQNETDASPTDTDNSASFIRNCIPFGDFLNTFA